VTLEQPAETAVAVNTLPTNDLNVWYLGHAWFSYILHLKQPADVFEQDCGLV
jgi:hypothetical protein